jgi:predicted DNA-binding transcriptional regulator AlpA
MRPQFTRNRAGLPPTEIGPRPRQARFEEDQPTASDPQASKPGRPGPCGYRNTHPAQSDARYIARRELRALFPVSDMTIWRWQHDPQVGFPAPIKLSNNGRNYWWLPAIRDWECRRREDAGEKINLSRPLAQGGADVAALH